MFVDINDIRVRAALIVLIVSVIVVFLLGGFLEGLRQDWMRMILSFVGSVILVFYCMTFLLVLKINTCFSRMENFISGKTCSVGIGTREAPNRKALVNKNHITMKVVSIFKVIFVPVCMVLGIISGFHENWFSFGVYFVVCTITIVICTGILIALKIDDCSSRLEEILSRSNEQQVSKEQRAE